MRVRLVRCLAVTLCAGGCVPLPRGPVAPPTSTLPLQRVVLYRSGVAYFERGGGARDSVVLRTRREHLSDLLKSLSVRHANNGALLSAHTPLAPSADGPAVAVPLRLGAATGEIVVSYVTGAPTWQASYRIVLPESGDDALLQAFAIVPNQSGDDWHDVRLSLSTSVPMSFRYDLHTPREVSRPDLGPRPERRAEPADKAPDRAADRAQSIDSAQRSGAPSIGERASGPVRMSEPRAAMQQNAVPVEDRRPRISRPLRLVMIAREPQKPR